MRDLAEHDKIKNNPPITGGGKKKKLTTIYTTAYQNEMFSLLTIDKKLNHGVK